MEPKRNPWRQVLDFAWVLAVLGGVILGVLLWSNFSDSSYLEDLGLDYTPAGIALWKLSPAEHLLFGVAWAMVLVGSVGYALSRVTSLMGNRK